MEIEYYKKNVYGNEMLYVKDPIIASNIQKLTGKSTLTFRVMEALKELGFTFKQVLN